MKHKLINNMVNKIKTRKIHIILEGYNIEEVDEIFINLNQELSLLDSEIAQKDLLIQKQTQKIQDMQTKINTLEFEKNELKTKLQITQKDTNAR
ncbi:hypothetical protein BCF59_0263 [Mycoplasmopsis mustelae]|uniref:DivIVA protein n=1 Tax=Mycoplasmopsis mustelae TaxID=171289 RepID=A0A4R7UF60_9BACT|nr:hypothetical protein [Mycoplasmopsis mustelae]TDV24304.1 hypothetical protein BCF59_0263 [Mycoplasmopsis mustelae]